MTDTAPRDLADRFQQRWLEHNPFAATMYGIPGYDHLLPDESDEPVDHPAISTMFQREDGRYRLRPDLRN